MQELKQRPCREASYGLLSLLTQSTSLYNTGPPEWRLGSSPSIINQENAPQACVRSICWRRSLNQGSLSPGDPSSYQVDRRQTGKPNYHTNAMHYKKKKGK